MAELAINLIQTAVKLLREQPLSRAEEAAALSPLRPPMIANNYQSLNNICFIGEHFTAIVTHKDGFQWINEAQGPYAQPKWGMVAFTVRVCMRLSRETREEAESCPA